MAGASAPKPEDLAGKAAAAGPGGTKVGSGDTATGGTPADASRGQESADRSIYPQIAGYEVEAVLGRGGMGVVYRARQLALNRPVALKMVLAGQYASPELLSRFLTEAEAVASLQHPHIVQVFDLGKCDGNPFFAMEFVDGGNLSDRIAEQPLNFRDAAEMVERLARAVQFAHDRGIIHRDLKPMNVLLTADGTPKIADFGLAKRLHSTTDMTASGAILGTPGYLAPEQARGQTRNVAEPADIYALGVILYELITGRVPFVGESDVDVLGQVAEGDVPSPAWLRPSVPRDLETICLKCLEKNPKDRYATAAALAADLRNFLYGEPILARRRSRLERALRWIQRRPARAIAAIALVLAIVIGVTEWKQYRTRRDYVTETAALYQNAFPRWSFVREGLTPITEGTAQRRGISFRITRRGARGPVIRLDAINGSGFSTPFPIDIALVGAGEQSASRRESSLEYEWDAAGKISRIVAKDRSERTVWSFQFTSRTQGHYVDEYGTPRALTGSGATGVKFDFSPEGYTLRKLFCDPLGNPQPNHDGSFGEKFDVDDRGLPVLITNLGFDEQPTLHRVGYVKYRTTFDSMGNLQEVEFLDAEGQPAVVQWGYSKYRYAYDKYGNLAETTFFGPDGAPAMHRDGYAKYMQEFDDHGNIVSESYFDTAGRPVVTSFGYFRRRASFDERGNRTIAEYFDNQGQPTTGIDGFTKAVSKYDEQGNRLEFAVFGRDGNPTMQSNGVSRTVSRYDTAGNLLETSYYDAQNAPMLLRSGYFRQVATWNEKNLQTSIAYLGLEGQPVLHAEGYAVLRRKHDFRGNLIEELYEGVDGKPIEISDGYAIRRSKYESGRQVESAHFDREGNAVLMRLGYFKWKAKFDELGHEVERVYLGTKDERVMLPDGYSRVASTYDRRGNRVLDSYFDTHDKATPHKEGNVKLALQYDDRGNVTERKFLGADSKPIVLADHYAIERFRFDSRGNQLEVSYWDADKEPKPTWHRKGHSAARSVYDERGRQVEMAYYDPSGQLTMLSDNYAVVQAKFSDVGWPIEVRSLDTQRRPVLTTNRVAGSNSTFDARGQQTSITFVGTDGQPTTSMSGYSTLRSTYDEHGRLIEESYFDPQGKPTVSTSGAARVRYQRDTFGREVRMSMFGIDGKPAVHAQQGHSELVREFDSRGNMIRERFLGPDGKPVVNNQGIAGWNGVYDDAGRRTEEHYIGLDGKPAVGYDGSAGYVTKFDFHGNSIETTLVDPQGRAWQNDYGYACTRSKHDDRNRKTEVTLWGADGQPVLHKSQRFHRQTLQYDERGNQTEEAYFGLNGKPVSKPSGFHRWTAEYDYRGLQTRRKYFDVNNQPLAMAVTVVHVFAGGQADRVGLKAGDVVVDYDGIPVPDMNTLVARRKLEFEFTKQHELGVTRGGRKVSVQIVPGLLDAIFEDRAAGKAGS